ncbi:copper amine oxidase N-terminal domain-containing protein [Paenibacillus mesophilus]|uniref:copper amine oxidase N-terminal domain-containing protein n=1 Tax=Paenibacillus mesophilus TaxID=2582849 RepID=UPI00110F21DF|nr:copper amine oxidase N-terminal domain-containing protein [Paenibacillus mesophilus]TMV52200.1 copper amine oxidase N-terminal domain-containing protein [Paenibacillus mesophilus]
MKRKVSVLVAALLAAASGVAVAAGTTGEYKGHPIVNVVVNGKIVQGEVPGINMEGTTLVPLKVISEALGAQVGWDQATSTASVTTAAPAAPPPKPPTQEDEAKRKLVQSVRAIYAKVDAYIDQLPIIREKIRIAKEFYDIKKNDQYFKMMNELYWKTFEDTYMAMLTETSSAEMNEAKQKGILSVDFMQMLETAHSAMSYYKYSVEHFTRSVTMGQPQFLEFYITSYASGFEEELKAKEKYEASLKQFVERANP